MRTCKPKTFAIMANGQRLPAETFVEVCPYGPCFIVRISIGNVDNLCHILMKTSFGNEHIEQVQIRSSEGL